MRIIKNVWVLAVLAATLTLDVPGGTSPLWGTLQKGAYSVGFSASLIHDSTRVMQGAGTARPIQLSVWYPAMEGMRAMTYRDYVALTGSETDNVIPADTVLAHYKGVVTSNGVPADAFDRWMSSSLVACRDAAPLAASFPVIIISQGNFHSAHHQAILAEFLASHGYVVATSPSQTRLGAQLNSEEDILPNMEEQAGDLRCILHALRSRADANMTQVAIIGHSFGARSAVLLPMSIPAIRAIVSLDGGIGIEPTSVFSRRRGPDGIPILHLYETTDSFIKPDMSFIRSLHRSDRYLMHVPGFHHFYFTSMGMVAGVIPGFAPGDQSSTRMKYEAGCSFTLSFLDRVFDATAPGALVTSGVDSLGITLEHLPPDGMTSQVERLVQTEKNFAALSVQQGTKPAFLTFLADDGIVFRPHPVNGKSIIAARPNPPITLDWTPACAEATGGLGYTTGPWILTFKGDQSKPPLYGNYFSIWKEDSTGRWRLTLDLGTSNDRPAEALHDVTTTYPDRTSVPGPDGGISPASLDTALASACRQGGTRKAYTRMASADLRLMRDGIEPITGFAVDSLALWQEQVSVEPIGEGNSSNNEIGYSYGRYVRSVLHLPEPEHGYYVHVWRKTGASFRLVIDLLSALPGE